MAFQRIKNRRRRRWQGATIQPLPMPSGPSSAVSQIVQPKLRVSQANDAQEREADAVAARVMGAAGTPEVATTAQQSIDRKCADCKEEDEQLQTQGKTDTLQREAQEDEEEELATKARADTMGGQPVNDAVSHRIQQRRGRGQPLPGGERAFFEPRFGRSFASVRLHTGPEAEALSDSINARAFTLGQDIFFNRNEFRPGDPQSRSLVAHELTHTVQQSGNAQRMLQREVQPGRVSCENTPRDYPLFARIGTREPTPTIQAAVTRALTLLDRTINELEATRAAIQGGAPVAFPTISDGVARALQEQLRIDPSERESWTGSGPRTIEQAIRWYRNIRGLLNSAAMRYICHGSHCGASTIAYVFTNETNRIQLCPNWWHDSIDEQAITLIHEASHLYYNTVDEGRGMGSSYCMETFICRLNNLDVCHGCD